MFSACSRLHVDIRVQDLKLLDCVQPEELYTLYIKEAYTDAIIDSGATRTIVPNNAVKGTVYKLEKRLLFKGYDKNIW